MAHVSISKAVMVVFTVVFAMFVSACHVSAQESGPAPAPSMVTGAGFSLPVSVAVVFFSLFFSLVAQLY